MSREAADPEWAGWAQQAINDGMDVLGATVVTNQCRTTLCHLQIAFADLDARDQALDQLAHAVPWDNSEGFFHVSDDDPTAVTVFVAREGRTLPIQ
jgi:hypothetical protein